MKESHQKAAMTMVISSKKMFSLAVHDDLHDLKERCLGMPDELDKLLIKNSMENCLKSSRMNFHERAGGETVAKVQNIKVACIRLLKNIFLIHRHTLRTQNIDTE